MLTDDELQASADARVLVDWPGHVACWQFELQDPEGVVFTIRDRTPGVLSTNVWLPAGLFVSRSGDIRIFSPSEYRTEEAVAAFRTILDEL